MIKHKKRLPVFQILTTGLLPSPLKKLYYRSKGYKIGKKVRLGLGCIIDGKDVRLGEGVKVGYFTVIRARKVVIDRYVLIGAMSFLDTEVLEIGEDTRIREQVYIHGLAGPNSKFKIGKRSIIQMSFINPVEPIIVGDNVAIGGHALLFTHGSWLSELDGFPVNFAPINIGNNVYIAWRVTIVPGVNIGDNVVIGAHSLVNKDIPANSLAGGCPAKVIKENYPDAKSKEERNILLEKMLLNFAEYIKYQKLKIENVSIDQGLHFNIFKRNKTFELIYLKNNTTLEDSPNDRVVIYNTAEPLPVFPDKKNLIVNIHDNSRRGSSKIGEELLKYLSRYGLRFDRID
ncbi:MAG: acyltransferase [Bacteroidota bacterium]